MTSVRVVGKLDHNFAWDGSRLYGDGEFALGNDPPYELRGAAASVHADGAGSWRVLRDPLGLNKLFWAADPDGTHVFAARPKRLTDRGHAFAEIRSVPRGRVIDVGRNGRGREEHPIRPVGSASPSGQVFEGVERAAATIRSLLDGYLAAIASAHPQARVFVCLSGGLDSSGIAALAREHFPNLVAVSFDLDGSGEASDDRLTAERLAGHLDIPLLLATATADQLLEQLDLVLVEGIDWRDFNVHAALVNAALAQTIAEDVRGRPALVLTGDLANEFLADYQPERLPQGTYYELPRLEPSALRASLVRGIDTCHREIGVFEAWDLPLIQPYAAGADAYLTLPDEFLRQERHKQRLGRELFGTRLPEYVYSRPKVRAQVGSADGDAGVLGLCVERGIDAAYLRRRFAALHDVSDDSTLDRFMRAGSYRTAAPGRADV
jgi:asparagine synthetase B (glutamine-hydrolysing)